MTAHRGISLPGQRVADYTLISDCKDREKEMTVQERTSPSSTNLLVGNGWIVGDGEATLTCFNLMLISGGYQQ